MPISSYAIFYKFIKSCTYIYLRVIDSKYSCKIIKKERNYYLNFCYLEYILIKQQQLVYKDIIISLSNCTIPKLINFKLKYFA